MKRQKTQKQRVLRLLEVAGSRGITTADLVREPTADGGPPILRLPSRIEELRRDGHRIVPAGRRDKCRVYRLAREPQPAPRTVPAGRRDKCRVYRLAREPQPAPRTSALAPSDCRPATAAEEARIARLVERWGDEQ